MHEDPSPETVDPVEPRLQWAMRLLTTGWVAVCAAPVASAIATIRAGWAPVIDIGLIATLTVDSVSLDPPLVGMPTSLGLEDGAPLSHLGPLGFWLLAAPTKLFGEPGNGLIVGSVLLVAAAVAAIAFLLRRHGDVALEAIALVLTAAMVASIGGTTLSLPFNPYLAILPLSLCLLAVWGVLAGHHRQLWVVVLAGSLVAQTHLGNVPLIAVLVILTAISLTIDAVRSSGTERRRLTHHIIPVGVGLGLLAWIGPILDQIFGNQNLSRVLRNQSEDRAVAGFDHGTDLAIEMTSLPPRWMLGRARDEDFSDPGALRIALSLLAVAIVVGLLVRAVRHRDRPLVAMTVVSIVALAAATTTSARIASLSTTPFFQVESALVYRYFWWPVGMFFLLTLMWGTQRVARDVVGERATRPDLRSWGLPAAAGLLAVIVYIATLGYIDPGDGLTPYLEREFVNADAIADLPGSPGLVVLRFSPETDTAAPILEEPVDAWSLGPHQRFGFMINLVAQLRLRGIDVRFADEPNGGSTFMLGYRDDHRADGDEDVELLYLVGPDVHLDPPAGYRLISSTGAGPDEPFDPLTVPVGVFIAE